MDDFEKKECLKILDLLTLDNLLSLTDTVTGRVVTVESKEEAVNAVMLYTRSSDELLRRRKVRRENLYQYLAQQGHIEHPAADKNTLLRKVLKFWKLKKEGVIEQSDKAKGKKKRDKNNSALENSLELIELFSINKRDLKDLGDTGFTLAQPEDNVTVNYTDSTTQPGDDDNQTMTLAPRNEGNDNASVNVRTVYEDTSTNTSPVEKTSERNEGQELAIHFSSWFYKLLESLGNSTPGTNPTDWGPQHFWQDAKLTVQCNEPSGLQETMVEGADLVSEKFLSMVVVDRLCFNPNISHNSVKGKQNPHGLVMVMVCGTVHRQKEYLGVFEQSFGLIRDPTDENNWKIKFSKLTLKASVSVSDKQLEGPDNQLAGPDNQLEGPDNRLEGPP